MKLLLIVIMSILRFIGISQELRILTFNIRYDTPKDSLHSWPYRKEFASSYLPFYSIDACGVQEALKHQIDDMLTFLPDYQYVGAGRDDGKEKGEYSPILFNTKKLKVLESSTFWLSDQPHVPAKAWDAMLPRIVTWAKFRIKKSGKIFYMFNTHFDHIGAVARRESAKLLLLKVKEIAGDKKAIITGDFNALPTEEPIQIITDASHVLRLYDTEHLSKQKHFGNYSSFTGFGHVEHDGRHIDYILTNTSTMNVLKHGTLSHSIGGKFASDHHPVLSIVKL